MQQQMTPEQIQEFMKGAGLIIIPLVLLLGLAIACAICWLLSSCLNKLPAEYRKQSPGLVWLLLIPCFPIIWNFFVYPKIAESFKAYFDAKGRTDVGDCGRQLAMIYCIAAPVVFVLSVIPFVGIINCLLGPAMLVIWIILLVKFAGLKGQVRD